MEEKNTAKQQKVNKEKENLNILAISAIIPVFNTPKESLDTLVQSLNKQTGDGYDFEVIIVDDGSEVSCAEYLDKIASENERYKVFHISNGGVSNARNTGIKYAEGQYITFIDADDYLAEDFFSKAIEIARKHDADVVYGNFEYVPPVFNIRNQNNNGIDRKAGAEIDDIKAAILGYLGGNLKYSIFTGPIARLFRTKIAKEVLFRTEFRIFEDLIYNMEFLDQCTIAVSTPFTWYYYVQNQQSATHKSYDNNFFSDNSKVMDKLLELQQNQSAYIKKIARIDAMDRFGALLVIGYIRPKRPWKTTRQHMATGIQHPYIQDAINNMKDSWQYMTVRDKVQYYLFRHKMYFAIYAGLKLLYRGR